MNIKLGAGRYEKGYVCYDKYPCDKRIKYIDLTILPLPFADNSIDKILMDNSLEHLHICMIDFIKELERILKPGGIVIFRCPTFNKCAEHERDNFTKSFFNGICTHNHYSYDKGFNLINVKGYSGKLRRIYYRFITRIKEYYFKGYEYELQKK